MPFRCGEECGDALPNVTFVWYIKNESVNVAKIQNTWISTKRTLMISWNETHINRADASTWLC